jgi:hypothetical protein
MQKVQQLKAKMVRNCQGMVGGAKMSFVGGGGGYNFPSDIGTL